VEDDTTRIDILSIPFEGGELTALSDTDDGNANPRISPDGKWLAYISFSAQRLFEQRLYLHLYSFQGGKRRNLTRMLDMDVLDYQFSNDSNFIYFLANKHGNVHIFRIPLRGNIKKAEQITQGRRQIESFDMAPGAKRILYKVNDITTPGDIFSCGLEGEDEIRLTDVNMEFFEGVALSEHREFWFTSNDGMKIQGWMIRPPDAKENDVTPMVLEIHGGPHIMWGNSFWLEFQILAARGFTVFYCNPRGSEGYGWKFKGLIYKKWGHDDFKDLMCGVDYMISKGNIDPGNLSVVGGSFGGFMTVWIIGHDKRFRAAVAQRGVYNLVSFYGCSDGMQLLDWDFGTVPWEDTWRLWKNSPIAYVKNIETPLLLIHSEADYRAGICTADELFVAMKKLRKEVVFIRYPREGHELSRSGEPDHRVDRLNRIVDWCDKFRTHGSKKTDVRESGENEAQR
jgi:dipeptidyl aminopeptidase/acylaminoacyl peptidase